VNFDISTVGTVSISPAGGVNNLYDFNQLIPPDETVRYLATFTAVRQRVSAFLDVSTATGEAARFMNLVQSEVDLISLLVPGFGLGFKLSVEMYPDIVNAFGAMPHLTKAADALFGFRPRIPTFTIEVVRAARAGEFNTLASTLQELGLEGAIEGFKLLGKKPGEALKIFEIIRRNYGNVFSLLFEYPAGSVDFVAE
jgi:hypothetical protein